MSLTAEEIEAVVAELQPLAGSRVDEVRVHGERALTLELFGPAGAARLLLSAEPDVTRVHVARERPSREGPAPGFQQLLRRELGGARLASLHASAGDRVVELRFDGPRGALRLVAELTGRHGNVFVVAEDGTVRAAMARSLSQRRALAPGQPYRPPAGGPPGEGELHPPPGAPGRRGPPAAALAVRFTPIAGARFPLSAAVEQAYAAKEAERLLADARRRLREPLRAAIARAVRAQEKLADEAARVPAAEDDRRTGDLLKQHLGRIRRGTREVALTEWTEEGPREVTVALDPALSPQQNLERYYRRYRRIVESAARVAARAAEVRGREASLRALLAAVDAAAPGELERLERDARRLGAAPRPAPSPVARRRKDEPPPPYRTFRSLAGVAILVGRGATENDALTARVARGNDLWLHARGLPGAHVVVRLEKGRPADQETLLDAAHLALHFSDGRGAPQADIVATRAKYVRKVKGAAPGAVSYSQERTIALRVEAGRIERLMGDEEGG